jgi:predicted site-specific integrase-resolvase
MVTPIVADDGKLTPLLTESEAAQRLHLSRRTLQGWRSRGSGGPAYIKLGEGRSARIRYEPEDVERFLNEARRTPAADAADCEL